MEIKRAIKIKAPSHPKVHKEVFDLLVRIGFVWRGDAEGHKPEVTHYFISEIGEMTQIDDGDTLFFRGNPALELNYLDIVAALGEGTDDA